MKKKIWIFSGEASGDMYGAEILSILKKKHKSLTIYGMGGSMMRNYYPQLIDSNKLGVIGFVEVLKKLPLFLFLFYRFLFKSKLKRFCPDIALMIDFPGFNFPLAQKLKKKGVKIIWFVSPQVWAWKKERIPKIVKVVDKMLVIFPFEVDTYKGTKLDVEFVGHPLIPILGNQKEKRDEKLILLLPGSRLSEIKFLLKTIYLAALELQKRNSSFYFILPIAKTYLKKEIIKIIKKIDPKKKLKLKLVDGKSQLWMKKAFLGISSSGTITIEASLLNLPLVTVYKVKKTSYNIIKKLYQLKYFVMPNILLNKEVFPELIQDEFTIKSVVEKTQYLLKEENYTKTQEKLKTIQSNLSTNHNCFERIVNILENS